MEQVVEGTGIAFHNGWLAVNEFLYLLPFLRRYNGLMAALDHFPLVTGDNVIGVGADALLMRPKDQMCALVKGIPQDMADSGPAPGIVVGVKLRVGLDMGDRDFFLDRKSTRLNSSHSRASRMPSSA